MSNDWEKDTNVAFRDIIRNLLGMPDGTVRPANQNAPTGLTTTSSGDVNQWATVLISEIGDEGQDSRRIDPIIGSLTQQVTETIEGQRHLVASVQIFRGNAMSQARRLKALFATALGIQLMAAANFGLVKVGKVLNVTQFIDTFSEERAQVEVEFYTITSESSILDTYKTFPVKIGMDNLENPSNEVIVTT